VDFKDREFAWSVSGKRIHVAIRSGHLVAMCNQNAVLDNKLVLSKEDFEKYGCQRCKDILNGKGRKKPRHPSFAKF